MNGIIETGDGFDVQNDIVSKNIGDEPYDTALRKREQMRIRRYYRCDYSDALYQALCMSKVSFKYDKQVEWITLYLFEDDPNADQIKQFLPQAVFGEYVFSDSELDNAEWLLVRSVNSKLDDKNSDSTYSFSCGYEKTYQNFTEHFAHHRKQAAPYEFSQKIKWGQSHILSSIMGGFYQLFCDDIAMRAIQDENLRGIQFDPVIAYKKGCWAENIHQMVFTEVLPDESLILDNGFTESPCPMCGRIQYTCNMLSRIKIRREYLGNYDFCKTNDLFGSGFADPFLMISNKAYRVLTGHSITKNLEFQPLLIE